MKPNESYRWSITLFAAHKVGQKCIETVDFIGTLDEALARADEFEDEVAFDVLQFIITRHEKSK